MWEEQVHHFPPFRPQALQNPYSRPFPQHYLLPCSFPELTGLARGCLVWPQRHWGAQEDFMKEEAHDPEGSQAEGTV